MTTNTGWRGKRAVDKNAGAGQLGTGSLGRKARTGQPGQDRTAGESCDGRDRTGWLEHDRRQDSWDRTTEMGQPWKDSHDNKVGARHLGHDIGYDAGQDSPDR
jgi:hypothetical protein